MPGRLPEGGQGPDLACVGVNWHLQMQAALTNCHRLSRLMNSRNVFFGILEAGKSKIKALVDSVSGESTLSHRRCLYLIMRTPLS